MQFVMSFVFAKTDIPDWYGRWLTNPFVSLTHCFGGDAKHWRCPASFIYSVKP